MRLCWNHTKQFFGETDNAWLPSVEYTIPQIKSPTGGFDYGSLADYLGIPPGKDIEVNALPFRAYSVVVNDWFRPTSFEDAQVIEFGDATVNGNHVGDSDLYTSLGGPLYKVSRYHDYFSSALPSPQRGEVAQIPLGLDGLLPVYPLPGSMWFNPDQALDSGGFQIATSRSGATGFSPVLANVSTSAQNIQTNKNGSGSSSGYSRVIGTNLVADLDGLVDPTWSLTVTQLRQAFCVQRWAEKSARSGNRYIETIKGFFGITSPDARLQRSEYLGGNRVPINIHEVTNNAASETAFVGDLGALSHTSDVHDDFLKSFTEHGFVISCMVLRCERSYSQGVSKMWTRKNMFDFYWPTFANISEQPVMQSEIYYSGPSSMNTVFGYNEAYSDMRFHLNRVCAEMRPDHPLTLASWHLSDDYDGPVYLSKEWLKEGPENLDRCLAVTSSVSNQFFADIYYQNIASRPLPMYSIPGLIDHY